jgi:hypothetical protein
MIPKSGNRFSDEIMLNQKCKGLLIQIQQIGL